ncbi:hypothetical protein SAMN05216359_102644 [Roseateles sp. YR242]|uniref:hypothetical protein n=1 Tax=Roseateles sp. YR242 TaxID=1855305 RepID=UPI0008AF80AF|nr:hypothetical protein [Roseateles sp. YR242]SEK67808.1 hypothetical protein SAMN05216359_102644 [Roseateles sp. YR242]
MNHIPGAGAPHRWATLEEEASAAIATMSFSEREQGLNIALSPQAFFDGDCTFPVFLRSPQAGLARLEIATALSLLGAMLADVDPRGEAGEALMKLGPFLQDDHEQYAQMMGHGKRWLLAVVRLLHEGSVDLSDRSVVCGMLARRLVEPGAQPAKVLGGALTFLRCRAEGGQDAHAIRKMLYENILSSYLRSTDFRLAGNKELLDRRVQDLLTGFGFGFELADSSRPAVAGPGGAMTAAELNGAAKRLQEKQSAAMLLVAHEVLKRVQGAFEYTWGYQTPAAGTLQPLQEEAVRGTLALFGKSLRFDLQRLLVQPPRRGERAASWDLHNADQLTRQLQRQLPELRSDEEPDLHAGRQPWPRSAPPVVSGAAMLPLDPPSPTDEEISDSDNESPSLREGPSTNTRPHTAPAGSHFSSSSQTRSRPATAPAASQDKGVGGTGVFSGGTGGASRRGPL